MKPLHAWIFSIIVTPIVVFMAKLAHLDLAIIALFTVYYITARQTDWKK